MNNENSRAQDEEGLANIAVVTTNEALVLLMVSNVTIVVDKNHFAKVCLQKKPSTVNALTQHTRPNSSDDDSGEFVATLDLHPQPEEVLAVKSDYPQPKIHVTMSIKGGKTHVFKSTLAQRAM